MHSRPFFIFGGTKSTDFNVILTGGKLENTPRRDVTKQTVPGRSGDLVYDNGRWNNTTVTYSAAILSDFLTNFRGMKKALLSKQGYQRLEDTLHPDEYRMAMLNAAMTPETLRMSKTGLFDLTFDCKPQRYLKSGEYSILLSAPGALINSSGFPALPLLKVYGNAAGTVSVGSIVVDIRSLEDVIILDSDVQDAYKINAAGAYENKNSCIYAPEFPALQPGENVISWTGGVEKIEIIPRWWTL